MGKYYYRPISSGYAELGQDIGAGITGGVDSYYQTRDDAAKRKIEGEDRDRRREREDLNLDIMLASANGGRGQAPDTPSIGKPTSGALTTRRGLGIAPGPDRSRTYDQFDGFFMENAETAAARKEGDAFALEQGRAADERERSGGVLGAAASALVGGDRSAGPMGDMYGEGEDPMSVIREGRPRPPVEGTPEWDAWYARRVGMNNQPDKNPTYGQAMSMLEDILMEEGIDDDGYATGQEWMVNPGQVPQLATMLTQGIDIFAEGGPLDSGARPDAGAMAGYPQQDVDTVTENPAAHLPNFLRDRLTPSGAGPRQRPTRPAPQADSAAAPAARPDSAAAPAAAAPADKVSITQDQADFLREVRGMSDEDIANTYIIN